MHALSQGGRYLVRISGITYVQRKTNRGKSIAVTSALLFLLFILILLFYSMYIGWSLTHPEKAPIPVFSTNIVPDYKDVEFNDLSRSVSLKGWYFENKYSVRTVIFSHDYAQNRLQFGEKTLDIVKTLLNKGYNVLLFDFRNSGISGGKSTSAGLYEKDDLLGAIKYIKSLGAKNISLIGFSMGASVSIAAASESNDVDAVIADSAFSDLKEYLNLLLPSWSRLPKFPFNNTILLSAKLMNGLDPVKFSPRSVLHKVNPRPVMFIHSAGDREISVENSRELYGIYSKLNAAKTELWETPGGGHLDSYKNYTDEYIERITRFLGGTYGIMK